MECSMLTCYKILEAMSIIFIFLYVTRRFFKSMEFENSMVFGDPGKILLKTSDVTFSGSGESVFSFLEEIEDEFSAKNVDESYKVAFCFTALRGNARHWGECSKLKASNVSWLELKSKLFLHYSKFQSSNEIGQHLFSMKYAPDTDFETFVWYFKDYYLLWSPRADEKEIVNALYPQLPVNFNLNKPDFEELSFCELISNVKRLGLDSKSSRNLVHNRNL